MTNEGTTGVTGGGNTIAVKKKEKETLQRPNTNAPHTAGRYLLSRAS
jgi:hypothetical protein